MRAYTATYLACWLVSVLGCSSDLDSEPVPYSGPPALRDERQDAGAEATNCELQGTWDLTLSTRDACSPTDSGAVVTLIVDDDGSSSDDFTTADPPPASACGAFAREVHVAADGCTISASSLATWCMDDRPQCSDYQLTLHVNEAGQAEVSGDYRRCWCGSPGAYGTEVEVAGSATRR